MEKKKMFSNTGEGLDQADLAHENSSSESQQYDSASASSMASEAGEDPVRLLPQLEEASSASTDLHSCSASNLEGIQDKDVQATIPLDDRLDKQHAMTPTLTIGDVGKNQITTTNLSGNGRQEYVIRDMQDPVKQAAVATNHDATQKTESSSNGDVTALTDLSVQGKASNEDESTEDYNSSASIDPGDEDPFADDNPVAYAESFNGSEPFDYGDWPEDNDLTAEEDGDAAHWELRDDHNMMDGWQVAEEQHGWNEPQSAPKRECFICLDEFDNDTINNAIMNDCFEHYWCHDCVVRACKLASRNESLYPPKCCERARLNIDNVTHLLDPALVSGLREMAEIHGTTDRTFCANRQCGRFLPARLFTFPENMAECVACGTTTCSVCNKPKDEHEGKCPLDNDALELAALAIEQDWKFCPRCNGLIEMHSGCNHMTCICCHEFCWLCGSKWRTCDCAQYGPGQGGHGCGGAPQNVGAIVEAGQVQWQQYELDAAGDPVCHHRDMIHRYGEGRCEGPCHEYMPNYLNHCQACGLQMCDYCTAARQLPNGQAQIDGEQDANGQVIEVLIVNGQVAEVEVVEARVVEGQVADDQVADDQVTDDLVVGNQFGGSQENGAW